MPSFQSPEPISGRPCAPKRRPLRTARTQCWYKARRFFRAAGQVVIRVLFGVHRPAVEEGYGFIQHPGVAGARNIAAHRQRQPQVVVRTVRAHAAAGRGMPPMLDIAFAELTRRAAQQVLAHERGLGMDERHHVLQLIAEAERAAGLVIAAAPPQTAGQGLIHQPAVGQQVEGLIGCFHLYRAQRAASSIARTASSALRAAVGPRKRRTSLLASSAPLLPATPSRKSNSRSSPSARSNATWIAAQGSKAAPTLLESCGGSWPPDARACRCAR